MRSIDHPVSEDDLHAYVDGFLPDEDRPRVERFLAAHTEAAARVRGWQQNREMLRRALDAKAREPIPSALNVARLAEARVAKSQWAPRNMAAGFVLALAIGTGAGWWARGSDLPHGLAGLSQQAALTQRVFVSGRAKLVDFGPVDGEQQIGWAGQDLTRSIRAPDLSRAGYRLVGGRRVPTEQGSACMFVYQNASGVRISIFTRLMVGSDLDAPMRPVDVKDASGFAWSHNGVGFSLISSTPQPVLHDLSNRVRDEMNARL